MMRPQPRCFMPGSTARGGVERRREVDRDDRVPLLGRELLDRRDVLDAGIVDQDVDLAEALRRVRSIMALDRVGLSTCRRRRRATSTPLSRRRAPWRIVSISLGVAEAVEHDRRALLRPGRAAMPRPMPLVEPVTMATLPARPRVAGGGRRRGA